jgi:hypothetical protein
MMREEETESADNMPEIDIEAIMREVRAEVLAKKSTRARQGALAIEVSGRRFSPEFYDHLYQAGLTFDVAESKPDVTRSAIPLLGPLLERIRRKFHELVIFYVNRVAADQSEVNKHLLNSLTVLSRELEALPEKPILEAITRAAQGQADDKPAE